jgi:hypothetical protein
MTLLQTKIHLRDARTKLNFDPYFQHQMGEQMRWEMSDAKIDISKMELQGYPVDFFHELRADYAAVQKRYDDTLAELRHTPLPLVG